MDPAATVSAREPGVGRVTADRAIDNGQIGKTVSMDPTPERIAADGAIGNCHCHPTTEDDAPPIATTPPAELSLTVVLRIVALRTPNSSTELEIPMESLSLTLLSATVRRASPEEKAWLAI